jgi:hypothetical protein
MLSQPVLSEDADITLARWIPDSELSSELQLSSSGTVVAALFRSCDSWESGFDAALDEDFSDAQAATMIKQLKSKDP